MNAKQRTNGKIIFEMTIPKFSILWNELFCTGLRCWDIYFKLLRTAWNSCERSIVEHILVDDSTILFGDKSEMDKIFGIK